MPEAIPDDLLRLCKWFNRVPRATAEKEKTVWKAHLDRVEWLKWYWAERHRRRLERIREQQEERERLEEMIEEALDIDVDEDVEDDDEDEVKGRRGEGGMDMDFDSEEEDDDDDEMGWEDGRERTGNREGEEEVNGLTREEWDMVAGCEDALEVREGASMREMVREVVAWADDIINTGIWRATQGGDARNRRVEVVARDRRL